MNNKTTRRRFLQTLGKGMLLPGVAAVCPALHPWSSQQSPHLSNKGAHSPKPNILMIVVDDLRPGLGCYGASHMQTPHIDALARDSLCFEKAYVQQALCAPSRASLLSGCRPETTGVSQNHYTDYFQKVFLKSFPDIPTFFFNEGYQAAVLGKVHHEFNNPNSPVPYYTSSKPEWPGNDEGKHKSRSCVEMLDRPDSDYYDGEITGKAVQLLKQAASQEKPFFIAIGYNKPHLPFVCPKKYADLYNRDSIKLSPVPQLPLNSYEYSHRGTREKDKNGNWVLTGHSALHRDKYAQSPGGFSEAFQRELRHGYYACVSFIDAQVGKLINTLKTSGQYDNTIILFVSDQGYHLGDHNWWTKGNLCEFDTRVPLIMRGPGQKNTGQKTNALVELVDIFPTLLQASGFGIPFYLEGTSFLPLLENPQQPWKKAAFSQCPRGSHTMGISIRTQNYRYTEWRRNRKVTIEFFDHITDPNESINVAGDPRYAKSIEEHRIILANGWRKAVPNATSR